MLTLAGMQIPTWSQNSEITPLKINLTPPCPLPLPTKPSFGTNPFSLCRLSRQHISMPPLVHFFAVNFNKEWIQQIWMGFTGQNCQHRHHGRDTEVDFPFMDGRDDIPWQWKRKRTGNAVHFCWSTTLSGWEGFSSGASSHCDTEVDLLSHNVDLCITVWGNVPSQ